MEAVAVSERKALRGMSCGWAWGARTHFHTLSSRAFISAFVLAVFSLSSGCQSTPPVDSGAVAQIDQSLAEVGNSQPKVETPPAAVQSALLPPIRVATGSAPSRTEQRFAIAVHDSPAREFFMGLVEGTAYNMVVSPGVTGQITLDLKNVTIPEVMDVVRNVYGFDYRRGEHGFEVLPARLRTRIYPVDYLNILRRGRSQTRVSSGQITGTGGTTSSDSGVSDSTSNASSSRNASDVTGSEIVTRQPETSFWSELKASVAAIIGSAPGRSVVVNPESGMVVVRAMPRELREVEAYLRQAQMIAARQVILEAKILEVELNDAYRQGVDWQAIFRVNGKTLTASQVGGGTLADGRPSAIKGNTVNLAPAAGQAIVGTAANAFGGMFAAALAYNNFTAFIELLDQQGTVHVLSSPRVATMNNQKAVIKVGSDEFFVTDVSSTTTTGTSTTTTPDITLTPFFSGVALDVTPQISATGDVLLHVHPTISQVQDQQKTITIGSVTQVLPLALSTVRESDSIVRARSGQIVVIGGLMQNRYERGRADSPASGLPVIGTLFSQRRQVAKKSELIILLKPIVIDSASRWVDAARAARRRIGEINRRMRATDAVGSENASGSGRGESP